MGFPSDAIRAWCKKTWALVDALRRSGDAHTDGFCQCRIGWAVRQEPRESRERFVGELFWAVWIDQVLCRVLAGPANRQLYEEFVKRFPFPKLYSHPTPSEARACYIISSQRPHFSPQAENIPDDRNPGAPVDIDWGEPDRFHQLLREVKREFWDEEVAAWLDSAGRSQVKEAAEAAFREDIRAWGEKEYDFLLDL